jgi:hypothetical protein
MRGKGLLLIGAIAGLVFAATPQGRKVIDDVKGKAMDAWGRPDVQSRVRDVSNTVRDVPVVGDDLADIIDKSRTQ